MDLYLKPGKDRPVRFGHPWIFSGALRELDHATPPGTVVRVCAADGETLATGYVNPRCPIAVRVLALGDVAIDGRFLTARVASALELRRRVIAHDTDAYRLINGEGDGLPGVVVDLYAGVMVLQLLTAGAESLREMLLDALRSVIAPRGIYERSAGSVRTAEGLAARRTLVAGDVPEQIEIREYGRRFVVHPHAGQKTGLFLDQRDNRALVARLAAGRRVLDGFAYSGGFAVHAGAGGAAQVIAVERSRDAAESIRRNWDLNQLAAERIHIEQGDVNQYLRDTQHEFDLLVLDPPALIKQRKDVARGARAYKDLHLWALRHAVPGALLVTFSCSQHVDRELFRKIVLGAAVDARRSLQLIHHLGPAPDHPVALGHPEGEYLHGLLLRVV
jgi:23S rRNA (cytosine1962-C5)-methyltransferase